MNLNVSDFEQCSRLICSIADKEFFRYQIRVSFPKLDKEDFYQNGWVALQDCINKNITDLSYVCVAIRNAMYRGVQKTSIIQTSNKREMWYYVSGHERRMEESVACSDGISDEDGMTLSEIVPSEESVEDEVINTILVSQIFSSLREDDSIELKRMMVGLPPKRRKLRELSKQRAVDVLEGRQPYKNQRSENRSEISGVTYDKSKNRWVFSKRIDGKVKTFMRSKEKEEVEKYAMSYYVSLSN